MAGPEFEELQAHVLVYTRQSMVQDLGEHVGMTNVLTFATKWIPNLPNQTWTYG